VSLLLQRMAEGGIRVTAHRPPAYPAGKGLDHRHADQPAPGRTGSLLRDKASSALRPLLRLGPFVIAVAIGKALLDYLPQSLSGGAARYSLAGCASIASGTTVALVAIGLRRQRVAGGGSPPSPAGQRQSIGHLAEATQAVLLGSRAVVDDPVRGQLVGWPHFIEEARDGVRPTAIGTAYGLKSYLLVDPGDVPSRAAALVETLWRLQLADKGWAARTQSGTGRPEVTALILGVLSVLGSRPDQLAEATSAFEQILTREADPIGMSRTYVVSAALCGLVRAAPSSIRLAELRRALVSGATRDPGNDNLLCWADQLADGKKTGLVPSIPHTARAIVALSRTKPIQGSDGQAESTVKEGIRWLIKQDGLPRQTEQIRRTLPEYRNESLTVRHFSAALVAKALLCPEAASVVDDDAPLSEAIRQVWSAQHGGVWEWDNGEHPLWMTYQGLAVLHRYALKTSMPPA
jgi:hypothetical protein